ncbi:MAG: ATP-binding protein [Rickettsiales bacterium]|nr:ATP-binding protein [Rickettsiales bacterium]
MSYISIVEEQIYKILKTDTPEVIAIRGAWGTGKTTAWKRYLKQAKNRGEISLKKYSYVSLFGVNSIEALKFALFERSTEGESFGEEPSLENFRQNIKLLLSRSGKSSISFIEKAAAFFRLDGLVGKAISYLSINSAIVCLDDFERMSLDAQDVLGVISDLKDQKKCKVFIILNDEKLSPEAKKKLNLYKEKVIDKEYIFSPTSAECSDIVFKNEGYDKIVKERCCKIGIRNIRVLQKIQRLMSDIIPLFDGKQQETVQSVLSSLVLFTHSIYSNQENIPDIEYIRKWNTYGFLLFERENDESSSEEEKQKRSVWKNALEEYGYSETDELDEEIAKSVERGYFINETLEMEIASFEEEVKISKQNRSIDEAWYLYRSSFDDNSNELIEKLFASTSDHIEHITPNSLNSSIALLRELNANDKADALIELVISKRTNPNFFDMDNYAFRERFKDPKMIARFAEAYTEKTVKKNPREALKKIGSDEGWELEDENALTSLSVDDFYEIFKTENGDHLIPCIRACLNYMRYKDDSRKQNIGEKTHQALIRIGAENELNKIRVKIFGIYEHDRDVEE